ncbi:hypothetical protein LSTR_LSTR012838 [Laodelphax striatellus]|uniref:Uncharacterized protein n=1 Tax=Laodelphax striatellus TaxID=195883 RepID=A0A482XDJ7_LAOST|nr:hypothetical protein LSTR_LSTR012838 [Laodelphax striatellus]
MKKETMRALCILAAISQISFILMVLCGYITIGVGSRLAMEPEEETSTTDKLVTENADEATLKATGHRTEAESHHQKPTGSKVHKVLEDTESKSYHQKPTGSKVHKESVDTIESKNHQHSNAAGLKPHEGKKHKLFNNLVDGEKNKQEEKNPPSTARWCRDVWENFSPEVDVAPYSDISGSVTSSYESTGD